jgi:hypothetical protein
MDASDRSWQATDMASDFICRQENRRREKVHGNPQQSRAGSRDAPNLFKRSSFTLASPGKL